MSTPKWQPGTIYPTGFLVQPRTAAPPGPSALANPGFEDGDVDWTKNNATIVNAAGSFAGDWHARINYAGGATGDVVSAAYFAVVPGQKTTVSCMISMYGGGGGVVGGKVRALFYDASHALVGTGVVGNDVNSEGSSGWRMSSVVATAPAGAVFMRVSGEAYIVDPAGYVLVDNFSWNYVTPSGSGLIYKAVQPILGTSDSAEPTWPTTIGVQVVDNTVIWEAVSIVRVTWEAHAILMSGPTEPAWPTNVDDYVADNTISWKTVSRQVTEAPNSRVVAIAAKKVFAADKDIIRYSATVEPLDWTSPNDAGYLPSGLNQNGSNNTEVLNLYRSNVVSFSTSTFQNWQVDPDPANMALLDAMEGIGSRFQKAAQPVGNDLYYLAALGIRTVGIAAGTSNLQAADAGQPVDPIIQAEIAALPTNGYTPVGLYFPALGQYWIAFGPNVYVHTRSQIGDVGAWSWYEFPWAIEAYAQLGDYLYLRSGDAVYKVDQERLTDQDADGNEVEVEGEIVSHYLDMGQPGVTKQMVGFDVVGTGMVSVQFGYDETNLSAITPGYKIPGDTLPGPVIPMPMSAPSFSMTLKYSSNDGPWEWLASNMYLSDFRVTS